jgi:hypothetical protein
MNAGKPSKIAGSNRITVGYGFIKNRGYGFGTVPVTGSYSDEKLSIVCLNVFLDSPAAGP